MKPNRCGIASLAAAAVLALGGTALAQEAPSGTGMTAKPGGIGLAAPADMRVAEAGTAGSAGTAAATTLWPGTTTLGAGRADLGAAGSLGALPRASGYGMGMPGAMGARAPTARPDRS